jgi:hypothetical protein
VTFNGIDVTMPLGDPITGASDVAAKHPKKKHRKRKHRG